MKWIGQHIVDLIARFRGGLYIDNVENAGTDTDAFVVLKNNKVAIRTGAEVLSDIGGSSTTGDITGVTAGTNLTGGGISGDVEINLNDATTSVKGAASFNSDNFAASSGAITIKNGGVDLTAEVTGVLPSANMDGDTAHLAGTQRFTGTKRFDNISSAIFDSDKSVIPGDGAVIHVDTHDVTDNNTNEGGNAAMYTHVNIEAPRLNATQESVTTTEAASLYISNAPTANTNQTITNAYALWVDAGLVKFDGALTVGGTITGDVTGDVTGNADTVTITDKSDDVDYDVVFGNSTSALYDDTGTLTYNPSDAALSSTNFVGALTGQADTVATIAGLAPNTATTQATQPAIESIGTADDTLNILSDTLFLANATTRMPTIKLTNITDDDVSSELIFEKLRDDDGVASGQNLGAIWFKGQDSGQNPEDYAYIVGEIDVSTHSQESGKLTLGVANHDGGNGSGLILTGGSENDEVDVTVGLGANSVVTIPGNIDLAGDIDVDGTLETDALTIAGATIAAIGTTAITTLGTIGTGVWEGTAVATDQQKHLAWFEIKGFGTGDGTNYEMPELLTDASAPFEHNTSIGSDGLTAQTVQIVIRSGGIVMPRAGTLKRWLGWATSAGNGSTDIALFKLTPTRNNNTNIAPVLLDNTNFTALGNAKMEDFDETSFTDADLAAGDIIFSGIRGVNAKFVSFNSTIEIEWD